MFQKGLLYELSINLLHYGHIIDDQTKETLFETKKNDIRSRGLELNVLDC